MGKFGTDSTKHRYVVEDWKLFRSVQTICRLSGVPPERIRRLVAKELVDNALDAGVNCRVGQTDDGGFYVEDDGPGIDPEDVAELFSFRRPTGYALSLALCSRRAEASASSPEIGC